MKRQRSLIIAASATLLATASLTACASSGTSASGDVELE